MREFERSFTKDLSKTKPSLNSRTEFGHWEGDTVELIRGQSYLVTMVERNTRFLAVAHVENKRADTVRNAILSMFRHFPKAVKSITLDNGTEFADHKTIANCLNAPVYFAHSHALGMWNFPLINGQRPLSRTRPRLAVFPEENESNLYLSIPRGLQAKT